CPDFRAHWCRSLVRLCVSRCERLHPEVIFTLFPHVALPISLSSACVTPAVSTGAAFSCHPEPGGAERRGWEGEGSGEPANSTFARLSDTGCQHPTRLSLSSLAARRSNQVPWGQSIARAGVDH